jgi:hypothetical protein
MEGATMNNNFQIICFVLYAAFLAVGMVSVFAVVPPPDLFFVVHRLVFLDQATVLLNLLCQLVSLSTLKRCC